MAKTSAANIFLYVAFAIISVLLVIAIVVGSINIRQKSYALNRYKLQNVLIPITAKDSKAHFLEAIISGVNGDASSGFQFANNILILLHDFPESCSLAFSELIPYLTGMDKYSVICVTQRGFGQSAGYNPSLTEEGAYSLENAYVQDVKQVLDYFNLRTTNTRNVTVVGHGLLGGLVAYSFAAKFSESLRHLITINAPHPSLLKGFLKSHRSDSGVYKNIHALLQLDASTKLKQDKHAALFNYLSSNSFSSSWLTSLKKAEYTSYWSSNGDKQVDYMLAWLQQTFKVEDDAADEIDAELEDDAIVPTSVSTFAIWSKRNSLLDGLSVIGFDQYVQNFAYKEEAEAGHWIIHEKPERVAFYIDQFLSIN